MIAFAVLIVITFSARQYVGTYIHDPSHQKQNRSYSTGPASIAGPNNQISFLIVFPSPTGAQPTVIIPQLYNSQDTKISNAFNGSQSSYAIPQSPGSFNFVASGLSPDSNYEIFIDSDANLNITSLQVFEMTIKVNGKIVKKITDFVKKSRIAIFFIFLSTETTFNITLTGQQSGE